MLLKAVIYVLRISDCYIPRNKMAFQICLCDMNKNIYCWQCWFCINSSQEKEAAERKAKEITAVMELLSADLQNEKQVSSSAMILAKRASKESEAVKRAIQSLGCKVHFSSGGDCTVDVESSQIEPPLKSSFSSRREADGAVQHDDKSDLSVSITVMADDVVSSNPIDRVCETLCPLRMRDGGCRWPDAGCAQLASQFVGLKANYEAFDKLSIYDSYFQPK